MRRLLRQFKKLAYAAVFPFYSLFSGKVGFAVFFPWVDGWRAWTRGKVFRVPEPRLWVLEYFRHFTPSKGSVVFDVGGELGFETEQLSTMVGRRGKVFVFECLPDHVARLKQLANERKNVEVIEHACWNENCELQFFIGHTPGSNTAVPDAKGQRGQDLADDSMKPIKVLARRLDDLWKSLYGGTVEFLKMDIEGAEYEALEGATEMLKNTRYAVIAAYHIRDGVPTASRVRDILTRAGFSARIDENNHVYAWR